MKNTVFVCLNTINNKQVSKITNSDFNHLSCISDLEFEEDGPIGGVGIDIMSYNYLLSKVSQLGKEFQPKLHEDYYIISEV